MLATRPALFCSAALQFVCNVAFTTRCCDARLCCIYSVFVALIMKPFGLLLKTLDASLRWHDVMLSYSFWSHVTPAEAGVQWLCSPHGCRSLCISFRECGANQPGRLFAAKAAPTGYRFLIRPVAIAMQPVGAALAANRRYALATYPALFYIAAFTMRCWDARLCCIYSVFVALVINPSGCCKRRWMPACAGMT